MIVKYNQTKGIPLDDLFTVGGLNNPDDDFFLGKTKKIISSYYHENNFFYLQFADVVNILSKLRKYKFSDLRACEKNGIHINNSSVIAFLKKEKDLIPVLGIMNSEFIKNHPLYMIEDFKNELLKQRIAQLEERDE